MGRLRAIKLLEAGTKQLEAPEIIRLQGPRWYSTKDVQSVLEAIAGHKVYIKPVDKDVLAGFFAQVLPPHLVNDFLDMTVAFLPGGLLELEMRTLTDDPGVHHGLESLDDVLRRAWKESKQQ